MSQPLLQVKGLTKSFPIKKGLMRRVVGRIRAVEDVSFSLQEGETLGLVGESGCGKTTTARLILRLIERTAGELIFQLDGRMVDLGNLQGEDLRHFRKNMQLILQDPFASLNPRMTVLDLIAEPLRAQQFGTRREIEDRVEELMEAMGLNVAFLRRYPHAFSGGQRQRIGIARALALNPKLVVCDEPISALDVSVQAQIVNLLRDLQERLGLSYLFIAHDLSVVGNISHRVAVMYAGRIVEMAENSRLFHHPSHPYTESLMSSAPRPVAGEDKTQRILLEGEVADPSQLPQGCAFHPRCRYCQSICKTETPPLREIGNGHLTACHFAETLNLRGVSG